MRVSGVELGQAAWQIGIVKDGDSQAAWHRIIKKAVFDADGGFIGGGPEMGLAAPVLIGDVGTIKQKEPRMR